MPKRKKKNEEKWETPISEIRDGKDLIYADEVEKYVLPHLRPRRGKKKKRNRNSKPVPIKEIVPETKILQETKERKPKGFSTPDDEIVKYVAPPPPKTTKKTRKIIQFSKNGIPLREWNSANEAAEFIGVGSPNRTGILRCCKGVRKTAYNFVWKFKEDLSFEIQEDLNKKLDKITKEFKND